MKTEEESKDGEQPLPPTIAAPAQAQPASTAAQVSAMTAKNPLPARTDIDVDKTISTYNGGTTANYKWSQQMLNVDV